MNTISDHPAATAIRSILGAYPDFQVESLVGTDKPARRLMNALEAMEYLGHISRMTLWRLAQEKKLRTVRIGSRVMYDIADLEKFVRQNKTSRREKQTCKQ